MNKQDLMRKNFSTKLLCLDEMFNFLANLHVQNKLPRALMLTGKKGCGKSTLIIHFMNFVFDEKNYDFVNKKINKESNFFKQILNNIFPNIIYLSGENYKSIKIDDIRNLKSLILKTSIINKERFIILDDIELFNINSLNAILKIIEEPTSNNHFIIINNQTKPLIETLYSRCINLKVSLNNIQIKKIIDFISKNNNLETTFNYQINGLTPGNFLIFNKICQDNEIDLNSNFLENIEKLLNIFKKTKDKNIINFILFLNDCHFHSLSQNKMFDEKAFKERNFIKKKIGDLVTFNINSESLINSINSNISNE